MLQYLISIDSPISEVGAGFIPAPSSIRAGLRAGINPAPTILTVINSYKLQISIHNTQIRNNSKFKVNQFDSTASVKLYFACTPDFSSVISVFELNQGLAVFGVENMNIVRFTPNPDIVLFADRKIRGYDDLNFGMINAYGQD